MDDRPDVLRTRPTIRTLPFALAIVASVGLSGGAEAAGRHHGWDRASSIGRDALVVAALGVPAVQGDWRGDLQAGGSILLAGGVATGLKALIPERRPDGSDRKSFPSGHASVSFAAAASLENRYGWEAGLPAFLVATFVGVGRVEARKHHWYDAVAGAGIGTASGFLLTSRHDDRVRLVPWGDARGGGMVAIVKF